MHAPDETPGAFREEAEALFHQGGALAIDDALVADVMRRAESAPRGRFRLCLHGSTSEPLQEMIIAFARPCYTQPHRHPHASTSITVLEGRVRFYVFDDKGRVERCILLGPRGSGRAFCARLAAGVWHADVKETERVIFYETLGGPFAVEDANEFAPWAPDGTDPEAVAAYIAGLA